MVEVATVVHIGANLAYKIDPDVGLIAFMELNPDGTLVHPLWKRHTKLSLSK